jgi:hypothetical protein
MSRANILRSQALEWFDVRDGDISSQLINIYVLHVSASQELVM